MYTALLDHQHVDLYSNQLVRATAHNRILNKELDQRGNDRAKIPTDEIEDSRRGS
jgi:hypothetical protein